MPQKIHELFTERPMKYGYRGDPYFWEYMEQYFKAHTEITTKEAMIAAIKQQFEEVSGCALTGQAAPFVKRFDHGGMSAGHLSGNYWLNMAIPMLSERFDKAAVPVAPQVQENTSAQPADEKKTVTLQMICDEITEDAKGDTGCIIFLSLPIAICSIIAIFSGVYLGFLTLLIFGGSTIWSVIRGGRRKKGAKTKSIRIVTDTCLEKEIDHSGDSEGYMLTFNNNIKKQIHTLETALNSPDGKCYNDEWIYNHTQPGDKFYLVYINKSMHPEIMLSHKLCRLDPNDFTEENGQFIPKK